MTSHFLSIDQDLIIHYEESGSGNIPLLFIPGWTMSARVFEHQLSYFNNSDQYRFITLDPRAHGKSSKTQDGHFYEQHGRDLHTFIEKLNIKNIVLCGWSFATLAVLSYISQYGADRLSGLIMLDGPPKATGKNHNDDWMTYTYDDQDGSQEFFTMGRLRNKRQTNIEFAKWMLEDKSEENTQWVLEITNQTPDTAAALLNATANFLDYQKDLISLDDQIPLLYFVREEIEEKVTKWAEKNTPTAEIYALGDHLMFWERSGEFNRLLTEFLTKIRCK